MDNASIIREIVETHRNHHLDSNRFWYRQLVNSVLIANGAGLAACLSFITSSPPGALTTRLLVANDTGVPFLLGVLSGFLAIGLLTFISSVRARQAVAALASIPTLDGNEDDLGNSTTGQPILQTLEKRLEISIVALLAAALILFMVGLAVAETKLKILAFRDTAEQVNAIKYPNITYIPCSFLKNKKLSASDFEHLN